MKKLEDSYKKLATSWMEDPSKLPPEEFFGYIDKFIRDFQV